MIVPHETETSTDPRASDDTIDEIQDYFDPDGDYPDGLLFDLTQRQADKILDAIEDGRDKPWSLSNCPDTVVRSNFYPHQEARLQEAIKKQRPSDYVRRKEETWKRINATREAVRVQDLDELLSITDRLDKDSHNHEVQLFLGRLAEFKKRGTVTSVSRDKFLKRLSERTGIGVRVLTEDYKRCLAEGKQTDGNGNPRATPAEALRKKIQANHRNYELGVCGMITVEEMLRRFCFAMEGNQVVDLDAHPYVSVMGLAEFNNAYAGSKTTMEDTDGGEILKPSVALWHTDAVKKVVRGVRFRPGVERIFREDGASFYNSFAFPNHGDIPVSAIDRPRLKPFYDHIDFLIPDETERSRFLDWIAFQIQHPGHRIQFTPLMVTAGHGTGRGSVVNIIRRLLGTRNCSATSMKDLVGAGGSEFHDFMIDKLFCAIHETREKDKGEKYAVNDKVRDKLTEEALELNSKYGSKGTQWVYTNFMLMSNHPEDALVLPAEDRRLWVIDTSPEHQPEEYYRKLRSWTLNGTNIAHLFADLSARDISAFNPGARAPSTAARERLILAGQSDLEQMVRDLVGHPMHEGVMTVQQICEALKVLFPPAVKHEFHPADNPKVLAAVLRDVGETYSKLEGGKPEARKVKVGKSTARVWILRDRQRWQRAGPGEVVLSVETTQVNLEFGLFEENSAE